MVLRWSWGVKTEGHLSRSKFSTVLQSLNLVIILCTVDLGTCNCFELSLIDFLASNNSTIAFLISHYACRISFMLNNRLYTNIRFLIMEEERSSLLIGIPFFRLHKQVNIRSVGNFPTLQILSLEPIIGIKPVKPFFNLEKNYKPVTAKSRRCCPDDINFINGEISKLLEQNVFEPSRSSWRA